MTKTANILEVRDIVKTYGKGKNEFKALNGASLNIKKGETVAIIGKSGSGKSTLMHLMALLDKPTEGEIILEGRDASQLGNHELNSMRNKMYGFVFQQFFLNSSASVLENVILPLKIAGVGVKQRNRRGMEVLKQVDLEDKAKNKANDLSGGQKQRVVIARALINNPEIIFADEPTGNLDSATGQKIEDMLFRLNKEKGITIIIVTHDPDLAKRCDRRIRIADGRIIGEDK